MAILITATTDAGFSTSFGFKIPTLYARINKLSFDKDSKSVVLNLEYFLNQDVVKQVPRPESFKPIGFPSQVICNDPITILANQAGSSAYSVAYGLVKAQLDTVVGNTATVVNVN